MQSGISYHIKVAIVIDHCAGLSFPMRAQTRVAPKDKLKEGNDETQTHSMLVSCCAACLSACNRFGGLAQQSSEAPKAPVFKTLLRNGTGDTILISS